MIQSMVFDVLIILDRWSQYIRIVATSDTAEKAVSHSNLARTNSMNANNLNATGMWFSSQVQSHQFHVCILQAALPAKQTPIL